MMKTREIKQRLRFATILAAIMLSAGISAQAQQSDTQQRQTKQ